MDDSESNREKCIKDQLKLGLDFPSYPQLTEMGPQFLDELVKYGSGIQLEKTRYKMNCKRIEYEGPPIGLEPFLWTKIFLQKKGFTDIVHLKVPITGPFTLASYIEIKPGVFPFNSAAADLDVVKQLADVLVKSCEEASRTASMISIDEPILSVLVGTKTAFGYKEEDIVEIFNSLKKSCKDRIVGTHICGRISPKLAEILLETEFDYLSHEFCDMPQNMKIYSPERVNEKEKMLSVGCVSTKNPRIESVDEILGIMKQFKEYRDSVIFTPDCGFRKLLVGNLTKDEAYEISLHKLRNMVEALEKFKASF
ncbi:hypothetical protein KEJ18_01515 [Candidatus Bathyarchaeota archaeon]|nr:hypothetical protein [Candidatus Bathyarchaeota archaeon]